MPIYEVVLQQNYAAQQCINRFNYVSTGTPASVTGSFALAFALGAIFDGAAVPPAYPATKLMRKIAGIQSTSVAFDLLSVKNLYSVTDFYESPFIQSLFGALSGTDNVTPALAYGFRTNRVRTDVRRATKRYVGVIEGNMQTGGNVVPAFLTGAMLTLQQEMSAVLSYDDEGNTISFNPAVCGKESYASNPAHPERVAYKYYETESEQLQHTATGIIWDAYTTIRTQVSRQYGRGR